MARQQQQSSAKASDKASDKDISGSKGAAAGLVSRLVTAVTATTSLTTTLTTALSAATDSTSTSSKPKPVVMLDTAAGFYHTYHPRRILHSDLLVYFPGTAGYRVSKHAVSIHTPLTL